MPDLSGAWMLEQRTTTVSRVAAVGRVRTETTARVVYELSYADGVLRGRGEVCAVDVNIGSPFVSTEVPAAFIAALGEQPFDAMIVIDSGVVRLQTRRSWSVVGADLDDPSSDPLPLSADAAAVIDQDGDGAPGVTVRVGGMIDGAVYVVQRSWSELEGTLGADGAFSGDVRFDQEQVVLGASRRALRGAPDTWVDPDPDAHSFRLTPLAAARCPASVASR